jgi:DnaJ-class molecular chaperone
MMTIKIDCPACEGAGGFETMTALSYSGNQAWASEQCAKCDGRGWIEVEKIEEDTTPGD